VDFDDKFKAKEDSITEAYRQAMKELADDYQVKRTEMINAYDKVRLAHESKLKES
jgi:hypothetical protein